MRRRWVAWCVVAVVPLAAGAAEELSLQSVQGTWYGWLAGTGVELKIATLPDGAVAYLKTAQPEAEPYLQEVRPKVEGAELVLESSQAQQPFTMRLHPEGSLLFGTYDDGVVQYTTALARAMPDVERMFAEVPQTIGQTSSPMRAARADARRDASAANLARLGAAFAKFAAEAPDKSYPPLAATPGMLAPIAESVYPKYVPDATLFVSPGNPNAELLRDLASDDPLVGIDDHSYWYLGYLIPNETVAQAFLAAFAERATADNPQFGDKLSANGVDVPRLRVGVEQLLQNDINDAAEAASIAAKIPVMIERPGFHDGGSNVLFLDGHVEFLPYPGPYPMTQAVIEGLLALEEQFDVIEGTGQQDDPSTAGL